ncbi:MAG: hypothetical protein JO041_02045 [Acidobacteria bacterium]|nr:hypothetical protein [Acidobacteriota bacterium]
MGRAGRSRREFLRVAAQLASVLPFAAYPGCGGSSGASSTPTPTPLALTDDEFLDAVERAAFLYFWEQAGAATGLVKDRALAAGSDSRTLSSVAATGFGLAALCIADQRGYMDSATVKARVLATLNTLLNQPGENGFFYHFVDMNTGLRSGTSEVSSIDTAILMCGVLTCRQHFQDAQVQSLANTLYSRVNWQWMLNGGMTLSQGWTPEGGFLGARWDTYSELLMLYLLAIGSTTYPIPPSSWNQIARPTLTYQGLTYITNLNAPLFIHQFSHAWFDFRNRQDAFVNYFSNSVTATQAHKLFCLSLASQFADYQQNLWGISASDTQNNGYQAWGGPPSMGPIDGSVVPSAAAGSVPFLPADCLAGMRNIQSQYPRAWQRYGYVGAFNPLTGWYDPDAVGIQTGITMLMAENQRTGFVWNTFMTSPEAQAAMAAVGFH